MIAAAPETTKRAASYQIAGAAPRRVERPATPEAAAQALRAAREAGEAVVPWGAGTKQGWGNAPRAYDVALDLTALDQVLEYEPADLVITVQAGVPLRRLQERLAEAGQFLALDPPYAATATVGGTLAANASGPSRLLYGTARDLVLGMRVANPAGELVKSGGRVVKNVVGYDLHKLHIGGLGTLGAIVETTFKVHPLPKAEATVAAAFDSIDAAVAAAGTLFRSQLAPRAVELVHAPLRDLPGGGAGAPGALGDRWHVLLWAAGSPATVDRQVRDASAWCREAGAAEVERLEGADHAALWEQVREFGRSPASGDRVGATHTPPATATHSQEGGEPSGESTSPQGRTEPGDPVPSGALVKLSTLPNQLHSLAVAVDQTMGRSGLRADLLAHAGNGVLYVALAGGDQARLQAALLSLVALAAARGHSAVIEEAPDAVKAAVDVWGPTRDDFPLMRRIKQQFDPSGTLNPGRYVGRL